MRVKNTYTQQQSNKTHNYGLSIKLHTYEMHTITTLLLNIITDLYCFLQMQTMQMTYDGRWLCGTPDECSPSADCAHL